MLLDGFDVTEASHDDIVVTLRKGDERRCVIPVDYSAARAYLARMLERIRADAWAEQSLAGQLTRLGQCGESISVKIGPNHLGLMRPWLVGPREPIDAAPSPFLIAFEQRSGKAALPLLAPTRERAIAFVRELSLARVAETGGWRRYETERQHAPMQKFVLQLSGGAIQPEMTQLEQVLTSSATRRRRSRVRPAA